MDPYYISALFIGAYLLGSIPCGKLIAHSYGIDIQKRGSGNIGFANVRRVLGWRAGLITLAGDIIKGFTPTLIALWLYGDTVAFFIGIAAIMGHVFPVWLRFRGGKGIATGLGVVLALQPIAGIVGAIVYCLCTIFIRISSVSSLVGLACIAIVGISMAPETWWYYVAFVLIALWTLRDNLRGRVPQYDI